MIRVKVKRDFTPEEETQLKKDFEAATYIPPEVEADWQRQVREGRVKTVVDENGELKVLR